MEKIALFPGSFDPITIGHEYIVKRGLAMFDKIVIAIGYNSEKKEGYYPIDKRLAWVKKVFENEPRIMVEKYD
jgi:pantetheine-phosphate adenylyltransferase